MKGFWVRTKLGIEAFHCMIFLSRFLKRRASELMVDSLAEGLLGLGSVGLVRACTHSGEAYNVVSSIESYFLWLGCLFCVYLFCIESCCQWAKSSQSVAEIVLPLIPRVVGWVAIKHRPYLCH